MVCMSDLEQHIQTIAESEGVEVIHRGSGRACRSQRWVSITPVRGQVSYLVALHELGHVLGPNPPLRLSQEAAAWKWALDNTIVEPTTASYRSILRRLDSYLGRAQRWKNMQIPDDFMDFLGRIENAVY